VFIQAIIQPAGLLLAGRTKQNQEYVI